MRKYAELWSISVDHFDPDTARLIGLRAHWTERTPLEAILIRDSTFSRNHLKRRLFEAGIKQRQCEECGQGDSWRGRQMALILDHINGVPNDHRLHNLRILCPNCAATLSTHCGRKNLRSERGCARCGKSFRPRRRGQRFCSRECGQRVSSRSGPRPGARKVDRPPYEQLMRERAQTSYAAVGRKYGVSDNAIRKWVRFYEREAA